MDYEIKKHTFHFKKPGGTSRGILYDKESWFVLANDHGTIRGIGECSLIENLSPDDPLQVARKLTKHIGAPDIPQSELKEFPAVQFALETVYKSTQSPTPFLLEDSSFSRGETGIDINGLIWMGSKSNMFEQIKEKIISGFTCLKLKIGAINFDDEIALLKYVRSQFTKEDIELRVDANGAFTTLNALDKLAVLAEFELHSIEQPIQPGQWDEMASLCEKTPLPIALDEELISIDSHKKRELLLQSIKPQYIILKPSLLGGLSIADDWINLARKMNIGWWATSALEGNIGLNSIAQWVSTYDLTLPQGLGTGGVFSNNISCPLEIRNGALFYNRNKDWDLTFFNK